MTSAGRGSKRTFAGRVVLATPGVAPFILKTYNMLQDEANWGTVQWGSGGTSLVIVKVGCDGSHGTTWHHHHDASAGGSGKRLMSMMTRRAAQPPCAHHGLTPTQ